MPLLTCMIAALTGLLMFPGHARALSEWDNVERIVVIGDLHGDYDKFEDMLRTAGLINAQSNWTGGRTHLVQLGDVPDRGAHSRMILDLLMRLEPQAQRAGGYVHALIGNHEAMNIEGDLRYVSAGEYASFADRNSPRRRDQYYRAYVAQVRRHPPAAGAPLMDAAFRERWDVEHPLGFVEHRQAWSLSGRYGRWVARHDAIIRINDTLFMHGGLGPSFADAERDALNGAVRDALSGHAQAAFPDILTNQEGPLWYRGLAQNDESAEYANLQALLAHHRVERIVVGHTKIAATVLPRFSGRVLLTDIAVPAGHSDPHAFLILDNGAAITVHRGQQVPLVADRPQAVCAYLQRIAAIDSGQGPVATMASRACTPAA